MTCKDFVASIDAYLDDDFALVTRERFQNHLGGCAGCLRYLESYQATIRLAAAAAAADPAGAVPEALVQRIVALRKREGC